MATSPLNQRIIQFYLSWFNFYNPVEDIGVEPITFPIANRDALSHRAIVRFFLPVEDIGVEPITSCLQGRRSSQMS